MRITSFLFFCTLLLWPLCGMTQDDGVQAGAQPAPGSQPTDEKEAEKQAKQAIAKYQWDIKQLDWIPSDPKDFTEAKGLFPGAISFGGGVTLIRFGGFIQANAIHDFQVAGNRYELIPSTMPVPSIHKSSNLFNLRSSRFTFEARSDTDSGHAARAYFEMDMLGSTDTSSVEPRLRQLWGGYKGVLVGKAWSAWVDLPTLPELWDLQGPNSNIAVRQFGARYSYHFGKYLLDRKRKSTMLTFSLEEPSAEVTNGIGGDDLPDAVVHISHATSAGSHVSLSAIVRNLVATDLAGQNEASATAWGLNFSGLLMVGSRDDFRFQVAYADGGGRYLQDLDPLNNQDAVYDEDTNTLSPLAELALAAAYRHFWNDQFRSNFVVGYLDMDNQSIQDPDAFAGSYYAGTNVIFTIKSYMAAGAEIQWGQRFNKDGQKGQATRFMVSFRYAL